MSVDFQRLQNEVTDCRNLLLTIQAWLDAQPVTITPADETPISTDEAAKRFGIAKQTLYQNAKKIKHTKRFGRLYFYPSDLRDYLNAGSWKGGQLV